MQIAFSEVEAFSANNLTNVNPSKRKQIILGSAAKSLTGHSLSLSIAGREIEKVHQLNLLGVIINDRLLMRRSCQLHMF
jgi:hypothetical protein